MTDSEKSLPSIVREKEDQDDNKKALPEELFIIPLVKRPFFPGMAAPLIIEPGKFYDALKKVLHTEHKMLALFLLKDETKGIYQASCKDLFQVGVCARVVRVTSMEGGGLQATLNMEQRIRLVRPVENEPGSLTAEVQYYEESTQKLPAKEIKAYTISIVNAIKDLLKLNPLFKEELQLFLGHSEFTDPGKLADFSVALTTAAKEELQDVLETFSIKDRVEKALILLRKELDLSQMQNSITQKIEANIAKTQKEFFLREQLRTIKKELGIEKDDKTHDTEKFRERIREAKVPEHALTVINEEMDKLSVLDPQSAEYGVCRNYLDWLTIIPWGKYSQWLEGEKGQHALKRARQVLDEEHCGLEDVKMRILEFIGVARLTGGLKGNILCLVGPPGVGKTSIGRSIANALGRKFYRFSVGGMRDEAEIKGHRRTYIGAMPGKLLQALKITQIMDPVIMLDEVDKLGSGHQGDPASALLEVLDPEQNVSFLDHYLDVGVDLSGVLFILTANLLEGIPEPLRDRCEILRLSGYILKEKIDIANKHLIPKLMKESGLRKKDLFFKQSAVRKLADRYAREAGVRNLENQLKKVMRKVALSKAERLEKESAQGSKQDQEKGEKKRAAKNTKKTTPLGLEDRVVVDDVSLEKFLGKPTFSRDRYWEHTPVGVTAGLAWTALGGTILFVEAIAFSEEKTVMKLTGQAGDVMKESAQIAWSYVHQVCPVLVPKKPFFAEKSVHVHIPEGATPKDGPSAGITMATALFSLLMNKPVIVDLGMTGELTLTGKVLPVGGIKEKIIGAKRANLKKVILPYDNQKDYEELADHIKKGVEVFFVKEYAEVFAIAFSKKIKV